MLPQPELGPDKDWGLLHSLEDPGLYRILWFEMNITRMPLISNYAKFSSRLMQINLLYYKVNLTVLDRLLQEKYERDYSFNNIIIWQKVLQRNGVTETHINRIN